MGTNRISSSYTRMVEQISCISRVYFIIIELYTFCLSQEKTSLVTQNNPFPIFIIHSHNTTFAGTRYHDVTVIILF